MSEKVPQSIGSTMYYLRADGWCHCGRSRNTAKDIFEGGISVYDCEGVGDGKWKGKGPAFEKRERLLSNQGPDKFAGVVEWFLVTGDAVGIGGDDESLLREPVPRKLLKWDGTACFVEVSDVNVVPWTDHPGYPNCECDTMEDILSRT